MQILVDGCPLCEMIRTKKFTTKLYYPSLSEIDTKTCIIIDSPLNGKPIIMSSEHIPELDKTKWGHMLYHARHLFGNGIYLVRDKRYCPDHFHCYITSYTKNPKTLPDLRYED